MKKGEYLFGVRNANFLALRLVEAVGTRGFRGSFQGALLAPLVNSLGGGGSRGQEVVVGVVVIVVVGMVSVPWLQAEVGLGQRLGQAEQADETKADHL